MRPAPGRGCAIKRLAIVALASCASPPPPGPCAPPTDDPAPLPPATGFAASVYWSSESAPFDVDNPSNAWFECPRAIAHAFERMPDLPITMAGGDALVIDVDPGAREQTILGTGISIEASSVANLLALSPSRRSEVLTRMFDPVRGMGLDVVRVTIGTSDFAPAFYTYDDGDRDPSLARFSIQRDLDTGVIDILHAIRAIAPDVTLFASPWSPPAWMKSSGAITGGALNTDDIPVYATYLRRFVEAYRDVDLPIAALTLQNEPGVDNDTYPSCAVSAQQEAQLAKAVKAEFATAGLATQVWIHDHNFDTALDYANGVFADAAARAATDGVAFHDYAGDPAAIAAVHARYPEQAMVFTEKALWGVAGVDRAAQYFRNGSTSYVSWVTMLDQDGKPNAGTASDKPRRFIRSLATDDTYWATPEHFLFALYSKLVRPGATRIASTYGDASAITTVAFVNADGTLVVIVANQTSVTQRFALRTPDGNQLWAALDGKTAAAYTWPADVGASSLAPVAP